MNRSILFITGIILAATVYSIMATSQLTAQSSTFSTVIPVAMPNERTGFFDQASGTLYVYDANLKNCVLKGQLNELGKPFELTAQEKPAAVNTRKLSPGTKIMVNDKGEKTVTIDNGR